MGPKKGFFGKKRKTAQPSPSSSSTQTPTPSPSHSSHHTEPNQSPTQSPQNDPMDIQSTIPGPIQEEQQERFVFLRDNRDIVPSKWMDITTLNTLGLTDQVQMLTQRLGLWTFLIDPVPTYKALTLKFLATFTYDRDNDTVSFIMRDRLFRITTTQMMSLLGFPTTNEADMDTSATFQLDLNIDAFKRAICGAWRTYKASQIKHPAIRYIQRILAHTLFGRGETNSIMHKGELFYIYCMLRRNEGEMHYMPHIGDHLAKHFEHVATSTAANGYITCGGVITKLATALRLDLSLDEPAPGSIILDIPTLLHMRLISRTSDNEGYYSKGPGAVGYNLPLTIDMINPASRPTWRLANEPTIASDEDPQDQEQQAQQPPHVAAPPPTAGPSNQAIMDYMVQQFTSMNQHFTNIDTQFTNLNNRVDYIENDAQMAHYYASQAFAQLGVEPTEGPPTPYAERRRRRNRRAGDQSGPSNAGQ